MENNFSEYLNDIGILGELQSKIQSIMEFYKDLNPKFKVRDIFVNDIIYPDQSRNYGSLWLFFDDFIAEAKDFNKKNDFDLLDIRKENILYWNIKKKDFEPLIDINNNTRLDIDIKVKGDYLLLLKSTRNNSDYLYDLFKKYFIS